ncbi:MAG: hypothetical protein AAF957_10035 [Planctomycetota bacterium]
MIPRRTGAARLAATLALGLFLPATSPASGTPDDDPPKAEGAVAPADDVVTQADINEAIDRGAAYILSRQQLDGSWRPDEHKYVSGQTGLCLYTLLKAGISPRHPAVIRGFAYLRAHPPRWTYGIACCLMALQTAGAAEHMDQIEEWTSVLLECQGLGFSYPGQQEDLSLTQYGCLGMRAAEASGLELPASVWEDCLDYAVRLQSSEGAFMYMAGRPQTGSMTAAGVSIIQMCIDALDAKKVLKVRTRRLAEEAMQDGMDWLGEHMLIDRNPDPGSENQSAGHMTRWKLYYLYGLERVGGLTGAVKFGDRDWYREASAHLVKTQGDKGQWSTANGEAHPGTCFGVLVLKRATAPTTGTRPRGPKNYGTDDPKSAVSIRITGDTPLSAFVSSWGNETRKKFEWFGEEGKGPRVWRVEYVNEATGEVLATVEGDPEKPARAARYAAQFSMPESGTFKIFGRALLRPIEDDENEEVEARSPTFEVKVDGVMTEAMREAVRDHDRDLFDNSPTTVKASSVHGGHHARNVRDGQHGYGWLSTVEDLEPWIRVEPDRPQRADHVVLSPYFAAPDERGKWGRLRRVQLEINGNKDMGEYEIDPTSFSKAYLAMDKTRVVREIKVTILEVEPGTEATWGEKAGIAEIELQKRPDLLKAAQKRRKEEAKKSKKR